MSTDHPAQKTGPDDANQKSRSKLLPAIVAGALAFGALAIAAMSAPPVERITYKSSKTGSSYYQMGVEFADAIRAGTDGSVIVTIEESQGSIQNVMEVRVRGADYVFTAPPSLVDLAKERQEMFAERNSPDFDDIRALVPIPSLTMHFVVAKKSGIETFEDLKGKRILLGSGSFSSREGARYIELFGLDGQVNIANGEASNAVAALKNDQIDGFVTAGSYPAPQVIEAAASSSVHVLSATPDQIAATGRTHTTIPAGTYAGQNEAIETTSMSVVVFATTKMSDDTAYLLTKTFWEQQAALAAHAPWWAAVSTDMLANIKTQYHPGALRYYREMGVPVGETQR